MKATASFIIELMDYSRKNIKSEEQAEKLAAQLSKHQILTSSSLTKEAEEATKNIDIEPLAAENTTPSAQQASNNIVEEKTYFDPVSLVSDVAQLPSLLLFFIDYYNLDGKVSAKNVLETMDLIGRQINSGKQMTYKDAYNVLIGEMGTLGKNKNQRIPMNEEMARKFILDNNSRDVSNRYDAELERVRQTLPAREFFGDAKPVEEDSGVKTNPETPLSKINFP